MGKIWVEPAGVMKPAQRAKFRKAVREQEDARMELRKVPETPAIFDDRPYWNHGKGIYSPCVRERLFSRSDVRRLKAQGFRQD